jgi:acetyltransferase-like isoleucine patch superfamily enzyme
MWNLLFYIKFFLKGCYTSSVRRLIFTKTTWIGKSVSFYFDNPGGRRQKITLGEHVRIGHFSDMAVDGDCQIEIKDFTTINTHCKIAGDVVIERYCLLSSNILISSGNHYATRYPSLLIRHQDSRVLSTEEGRVNHSKPVHIEEDAWIGCGVFIKQGVTIGRGAVIGANSTIVNNIPPYEIHAGSPARKLKSRFDFSPKSNLDAGDEAHRPYFYRGFRHDLTDMSVSKGIAAYWQSAVAVPRVRNGIVRCQGRRLCSESISLNVSIDGGSVCTYSLSQETFDISIEVTNTRGEHAPHAYSFINFVVPKTPEPLYSIERVTVIESL